jgi:polyisoprenyl-phosphate glycosyltransferase
MPQLKIWFVSPCFFDVESFCELRRRCLDIAHNFLPDLEPKFVVIDDSGGQDSQVTALSNAGSTTVLVPPYNMGHQSAIVFALRSIVPNIDPKDYIVTLDCDGEDKPEDIPSLIDPLFTNPDDVYAVSLAQRTKRTETLKFKTLYFFFKIFFFALTGSHIKSGNFAAFRGQFIKSVIFHPYFDYCYSSSFIALPLKMKRVPIARGSRYFGKSKMTFVSLIGHGFRMLLPFSERIAIRAAILSGALLLLSIVSLIFTLFFCEVSPDRYTWLIIVEVLSCFCSIFLFIVSFVFFATFHQTRAINSHNWSPSASQESFKTL